MHHQTLSVVVVVRVRGCRRKVWRPEKSLSRAVVVCACLKWQESLPYPT